MRHTGLVARMVFAERSKRGAAELAVLPGPLVEEPDLDAALDRGREGGEDRGVVEGVDGDVEAALGLVDELGDPDAVRLGGRLRREDDVGDAFAVAEARREPAVRGRVAGGAGDEAADCEMRVVREARPSHSSSTRDDRGE